MFTRIQEQVKKCDRYNEIKFNPLLAVNEVFINEMKFL